MIEVDFENQPSQAEEEGDLKATLKRLQRWAAQIPYWERCGGFFQRGKRDLESGRKWP